MIILGTNSIKAAGGYNVANSARFDSGSSDYLNRTPSSTSNRKTFTFSFWVKRTKLGSNDTIYNVRPDSNGANRISFHSTTNTFRIALEPINKYIFTTRKFRDPSAWYHFVLAFDTTQGTAANRVKIYINGVQEGSLIKGDGGAATYPDQNTDLDINTQNVINIGRDLETSSDFIDMYLSEFVFIDGTALDPTSFGEFDDSGIWKPIDVSGLTFGTNGFYLDFEDSGDLGDDESGNGNDFTENNLTAVDQSTDTCTNNFATLNPLGNYFPASTFSEGNLKVTFNSSNYSFNNSTIGVSSGKWYFETKIITTATDNQNLIGISDRDSIGTTDELGSGAYQYALYGGNSSGDSGTGKVRNNNSYSSYSDGTTYTAGNIIGTYVDLDNNKIYFSKDGTLLNSGTGFTITAPASTDSGFYFLSVGSYSGSNSPVYEVNFGSPSFAISSGNTDDNGYGNFEYSPNITGDSVAKKFYALNTKNLAEYG
jgi:hypothetical protein